MIGLFASTGGFLSFFDPELFLGVLGGFRPLTHEGSLRQIKIGQIDQRERLGGVRCDPHVVHLHVNELALDGADHVFATRTDRGRPVAEALVPVGQRAGFSRLERHTPAQAWA